MSFSINVQYEGSIRIINSSDHRLMSYIDTIARIQVNKTRFKDKFHLAIMKHAAPNICAETSINKRGVN
jgi:hypothetical protein